MFVVTHTHNTRKYDTFIEYAYTHTWIPTCSRVGVKEEIESAEENKPCEQLPITFGGAALVRRRRFAGKYVSSWKIECNSNVGRKKT